MKTQDFLELLQLCRVPGIRTFGELKQYKTINGIKTNADLLAELEKSATITD